jgi:hypothetical protein
LIREQTVWIAQIIIRRFADALLVVDILGGLVRVSQDGLLTIKYIRNNKIRLIRLKSGRSLVPLASDDHRTIHFTSIGIDIRNSRGLTMFVRVNEKTATFPISTFSSYGDGEELTLL